MSKKKQIWTFAVIAAATAITIYYLRKKNAPFVHHTDSDRDRLEKKKRFAGEEFNL